MLSVLIVDDESLVRKGLVSVMPWEKYGFEIVGEASNGKEALEFARKTHLDLIITDLVMPVMSGIELIVCVHNEYPSTSIVVLTCYQDFEYVREAFLYGAIDYIIKTQLEESKMDAVLEAISRRTAEHIAQSMNTKKRNYSMKYGVLLSMFNQDNGSSFATLYDLDKDTQIVPIDEKNGYILFNSQEDMKDYIEMVTAMKIGNLIITKVSGINSENLNLICNRLLYYLNVVLFYHYIPDKKVYELEMDKLEILQKKDVEGSVKSKWSSLCWVYNRELEEELLSNCMNDKFDCQSLKKLFTNVIADWNRIFVAKPEINEWMNRIEGLCFWNDWLEWLLEVKTVYRSMKKVNHFSNEIVTSILKAVEYMHEQSELNFTEMDISKIVNMSRGYFSECFREITGKVFSDFFKELRLEKSKELLVQTSMPIYWVAQHAGFNDEKYFSKVFSRHTGMLPSQFRKTMVGIVSSES